MLFCGVLENIFDRFFDLGDDLFLNGGLVGLGQIFRNLDSILDLVDWQVGGLGLRRTGRCGGVLILDKGTVALVLFGRGRTGGLNHGANAGQFRGDAVLIRCGRSSGRRVGYGGRGLGLGVQFGFGLRVREGLGLRGRFDLWLRRDRRRGGRGLRFGGAFRCRLRRAQGGGFGRSVGTGIGAQHNLFPIHMRIHTTADFAFRNPLQHIGVRSRGFRPEIPVVRRKVAEILGDGFHRSERIVKTLQCARKCAIRDC